MKEFAIGVLALVVGVIIGAMGATMSSNSKLGGVTVEEETFVGDVTMKGALTLAGDATVGGGDFTVTTTNSATSSTNLGCIETTATSTATPIKIIFGKVASTATTTLYDTSSGAVYWKFGSCP